MYSECLGREGVRRSEKVHKNTLKNHYVTRILSVLSAEVTQQKT